MVRALTDFECYHRLVMNCAKGTMTKSPNYAVVRATMLLLTLRIIGKQVDYRAFFAATNQYSVFAVCQVSHMPIWDASRLSF